MKLLKINKLYEWLSYFILMAIMLLFLFFSSYRSVNRFILAIKTLGTNLLYFVLKLFDLEPTFKGGLNLYETFEYSSESIITIIPIEIDVFSINLKAYFKMLLNFETYKFFLSNSLLTIKFIMQIFLIFVIVFSVLYLFKNKLFASNDKPANVDTKGVIRWKVIKRKVLYPVVNFVKDYISYNFENCKRYILVICLLFCFHINLVSIALDLVSWYLYFFIDFNFISIFEIICSIFIDLGPFLLKVPFFIYCIVFYIIFDKWRLNRGIDNLYHMENYNKGFINSLGAYTFITGSPGAGKTTLMTDMTLSSEELRRNKLLDIMKEIQLMYPHFPFIILEKDIDKAIEKGFIKNHYQAQSYIKKIINKFIKTGDKTDLFNYDIEMNNLDYNNGLFVETLFESLIDYVSAYSFYSLDTPLVASNYAIRFNNQICDYGFYKRWIYDYFTYDPKSINYYNNSKILDFNYMRIQQKMDAYDSSNSYLNHIEDKNGYVLDCVGVTIMEITTERKNQLYTNRIKKDDTSTHQLNDGFNNYARVKRHDSTIRNQMIFQCFMDGQRVGDLNSALAEINEYNICIHKQNNEWKYALPLYFYEPMICEWILEKCNAFIDRYRLTRGDNSFLIYIVESIAGKVKKYYLKRKNDYHYMKMDLEVKSSVDNFNQNYFLMKKKIYSRRFSTAGFSLFFEEKYLLNENYGFTNIPNYHDYVTSAEEFRSQNSYLVKDLTEYTSNQLNDSSFEGDYE